MFGPSSEADASRSPLPMEDVGVQIVGTDGKCASLTQLYYCQSCKVLKSNADVAEEVDSFFCPHCLENMPSAEATLFLNRYALCAPRRRWEAAGWRVLRSCSKCFECPCCTSTLQTRVSEDGIYYLECSFCRWHSKTIDLVSDNPEALSRPPSPERFYWFDAFSIDEHATQSMPQTWWGTTFRCPRKHAMRSCPYG